MFPKSPDLMHPLMQDRDDADVAIAEAPPIDEMPLVSEDVAVDPEIPRHRPRQNPVRLDPCEGFEQTGDVTLGLVLPPAVPCVAVDLVETVGGRLLDPDCHRRGQGLFGR